MSIYRNLAILALAAVSATAAPMTFDFKDPKGVNNAVFRLDAPLESINGTATGVSGTATFDPENPGALKGKIVIASNSLHVGNPMMKEHLHGELWMDVAKYPEITFEAESTKNAKTQGNTTTVDLAGKITIKGVTKPITIPVKLTYLKDKLKDRVPGKEGDLLVVRTQFQINRSEFGVNAGKGQDNVAESIDLSLSIAGAAPK